jgi:hypothetical protein
MEIDEASVENVQSDLEYDERAAAITNMQNQIR